MYWVIKVKEIGQWPYEHRLLMEKKLGRKLLKNEDVHHLNGDTLDNRLENLQVLTKSEHMRMHSLLPKDQWAKNFDKCIVCKETGRRHLSKGMCTRCYQRVCKK